MLIKHLKVSGLLSFGPNGIDLPMRKLNVLIGPNGSGKSNLLEVINLFKEAPSPLHSIAGPMFKGGVDEWFWKGGAKNAQLRVSALFSCTVAGPKDKDYEHEVELELMPDRNGVFVTIENISIGGVDSKPKQLYLNDHFGAHLWSATETRGRVVKDKEMNPSKSILAQIRDPGRYKEFQYLQDMYSSITMYRDWSFGPHASLRNPGRVDDRNDVLSMSGHNLAVVAGGIRGGWKEDVIEAMQALYPDIQNFDVGVAPGGMVQLYLKEANRVEIPATRLSDGTLRYLSLLIILLDPAPPPLIVIEEPEMGLHPDVIPQLAKLLMEASERTQLVVTTHSRMLIDCLGDHPESVIVCEKHEGESVFQRLDGERMKVWLEKYSLGDLWSKGELGGNRW